MQLLERDIMSTLAREIIIDRIMTAPLQCNAKGQCRGSGWINESVTDNKWSFGPQYVSINIPATILQCLNDTSLFAGAFTP